MAVVSGRRDVRGYDKVAVHIAEGPDDYRRAPPDLAPSWTVMTMPRLRRHLALMLGASTMLTACIVADEVVDPPNASPTSTASASPSATAQAPTNVVMALADDPAALAVATLRAEQAGGVLRILDRVLGPDDYRALRSAQRAEILTTVPFDGARIARSAKSTSTIFVQHVESVPDWLAQIAADGLRANDGRVTRLAVTDSLDPKALLATVEARTPGDAIVAVDGDLRESSLEDVFALAQDQFVEIVLPPSLADNRWMIDVVRAGLTAPGGGQLLSEKRFIAAYGVPGTRSLGVLGEQGVAEAHARILKIAEPYDDGDRPIVATFEIIAAVASASATEDGDYSYGIGFDLIREWVDYAAENDLLVVLDIQPGRTDFLTHAKQYEEFLVQPHVGLGLDPEWRLKPNQVHLRQIGSVDGAEINNVVDYLAGLVRDHNLPQKMLVLHQFRHTMITNKDIVRAPDELMVVLHFDGQGGQPAKESGYLAYSVDEQDRFAPGWKNFYDEDIPMAGAPRVLALEPQPVFISFQ